MKKPTFSNLPYYLLSLLKSLFLTDLSNSSSSFKVQLCQRRLCFKTSFFSVNQFRAIVALVLFLFLHSSDVLGQNIVPFTPRYDKSIKGDMLLIGNNILNRDEGRKERPSDPFNADDQNNNDLNMQYIDVDSDNTTFSSSSARLTVPQASRSCYKVAYAAIYWAGIYDTPSVTSNSVNRNNLGKVKLKIPGQTTYSDITGTLIYDYYPNTSNGTQIPYAYYYDATALIKNLSSIEGDYTLANIISGRGTINGGFSAGWSLFVVYEDPNASAKYITSYDGFSWIQASSPPLSYDVTGFKTIPTGPVRAKLAFAALEGDVNIKNDSYFVNGTRISTADRPIDNFFNSTINTTAGAFTDRTPASGNTLGFETGIINLNNANNGIIANNDTKAKLELRTSGDGYGMFFNAFNVEIIEPKVVLTKIVQNSAGVDIGNQNVTLGQVLNYVIGLQNTGNDNATSVTIRDILPINTIFNYPADPSSISLPAGVTVKSYNAATREIVFDVDKSIVEVGDGVSNIRLRVQVVPSCNMLSDACSNSIDNQAFATYKGTLNPNFTISDDPSVNTNTGCLLTPKATNFLVGIDDCKFTKNEVLCGNSVVLTAANGYSSYKWSTAPFTKGGVTTGPIIGNSQTLTVTNPGTYYVYNTAIAPCLSITEEVTVTRFGGVTNNPIQKPVADQIVICPNDGKELPNIFLCGGDATRVIDISSVSAGSTVVWEKLNEASCAAVANPNCANESTSCTWTQVGTGSAYIANTSGQFRLTLNYPGGCFNRFYFNVYQNLLKPTETHRDIICNTKGNITVGGVGTGYEYSISNANGSTPTAYVSNNSFTINTAGLYTVFIRQIGVVNGCVFTIPNIQILQRNFNVSASVTQPLCFGERGSITVVANNGYPDYTYYLYDGATLVSSVGPISSPNHTFVDQTPGKSYRVRVTTADGCDSSQYPYINQPSSEVKATAAIVEPLTACSDGKIVVTAQGGNGPYQYLISGSTEYVSSGEFIITTPGTYSIQVVDRNNCNATATVTVPNNAKPTYRVNHTNSTCYGNGSQISIDNIVANGYSLSYSIDNGATFVTNPIFNNLYPGSYNVVVKYGITYMSQWNGQQTKYCTAPAVPITITGPTSAVTASGGVGELAGCSTSATGEPLGLLRITNVEGGNSPYSFSFDGGNTWQSSSEKYVPKGVYNLAVRDSNGCVFQIPYTVTLDPKPADPIIQDNINTLYNCDGTATATVIVDNPVTSGGTTYTYEYFMQKNQTGPIVPNSPISSNVFTNVPSGNHNVIVKYNVKTVSSFSNLLQEDFGRGDDTTSPGINSAYCWEKQDGNTLAFAACSLNDWHPWLMNDGDYVVTKGLLQDHFNDFNWWLPKDHTAVLNNTPGVTDGRFLAVNIGKTIPIGAVLYSKPINDVLPNQDINVTLYMTNLLKISNNLPSPQLRVQLVKNGAVIASQAMPDIPRDEKWHFSTDLAGALLTLNPGNNTSLDFQIISNSTVVNGNDLAIDDIHVYQIPKACGNERTFPIKIDGSKAFKASAPSFTNPKCSGDSNGTITIAAENFDAIAGYQYAVDGETTFHTTTVSPLVLTGFGTGSHTIIVRNDASGTCSYTLTQAITAPTAVTVAASVTTLPTCTTGATITAIGSGGTPAYEYELRADNGTTVITAFRANGVFTNVPAGNYKIFVRDANLCLGSGAGVAVNVTPPTAPTATLASSSDLCYDTVNQASLVVNVTGGTAPFTYSLDGAAAQNSNTFNNVGSGTHAIVVTDSNNCTTTISNIVIAPQLAITATLTQDLTCLVNGSITTSVSGGNGAPYTYTVSRNGGAPTAVASFPYTVALDGNYVFTVTDSKGCQAISNTTVVSPKTTPTLTFVKTDITCNNANNGTITVTAANGFTSIYTYAIKLSSASTYTTQASNQFKGLATGTYNIKVIDSKGCESAVTNVTIANPSLVSGTISATELQCSATGTVSAVVTVTGSGGTAPYKYSFNGTSSFTATNTFSTAVAGTVTAYIQDANGCQFGPLSINIAGINPFTDISVTDSGYDCSTTPAGGHVNIATIPSGVSAPIRFQIISGPAGFSTSTNSDGEFKSLAPGAYIFRATNTKTNCFIEIPYTVNGAPDIVAGGNVVTPIKCFGGTGTIQFTVNGAKDRGYDYEIKNAANVTIQSANNVSETVTTITVATAQPVGSYTITVTDRKTKCTATYTIILSQPTAAVSIASATATNVNCNNDNSQITVTATGGTPNYTYAAVITGATAPVAAAYGNSNIITVDTNSSANLVWDVYVKDANGCIVATPTKVTIISDPTPSVTAVVSNQCAGTGSNFTITATGTGGTGTLTYGINGATGTFQSSSTFTVIPGTYTVWVKDGNGCTASIATPLTVSPQLTASSAVTKALDCSGSPDAIITTSITGGKTPFTYTVQKGSGTASAPVATTSPFTYSVSNANADTYTFVITDANNCTFTTTATVSPITNPTVTETHVDPLCNGNSNGSVQLTGAGGSGGYTYSTNATTGFTATSLFTGLAAGTYSFYVKDSKGCTGTVSATLIDPIPVVASATIPTNTTCSTTTVITVSGSGGAGGYTYSFNGSSTYTSVNTLSVTNTNSVQNITYSVKDSKGCIDTKTIAIPVYNPPTGINFSTPTAVTCTTTTSSITLTSVGGIAPLTYTIVSGPSINTSGASSGIFTSLLPGNYVFEVKDANGCTKQASTTINPAPVISVAGVKTDVKCFGATDGTATFTITGASSSGNYTYTLTPNSGTATKTGNVVTVTGLGPNTYSLVVTDISTGCTSNTTSVTINAATGIDYTVSGTKTNCKTTISTLTFTGLTGGTPGYTYAYAANPSTVPSTVYGTSTTVDTAVLSSNIDVYVKDTNGCFVKKTVVIGTENVPTINTPASQCYTGAPIAITITGSTVGTPSYSIDGVSYSASPNFSLGVGSHTLYIKDGFGCTAQTTYVVAPQLTLTAASATDTTCTPNTTINLTASGGTGTYTYAVSSNGGATYTTTTSPYVTGVAGTYRFRVTDSATPACQAFSTDVIVITKATVLTLSTAKVDVKCKGDATGSITITPTSGKAPYTYSVTKGGLPISTTAVTTGLTAGTYDIIITDALGCNSASTPVTINEPLVALSATAVAPPTTTCGTSTTVTVTGNGGTAPYTYSFNGGAFTTTNTYVVNDNGTDQTVSYQVRDANGCTTISQNITVFKLNPPTDLTFTPFGAITCTLTSTTITLGQTGGAGTLQYETIAPSPIIVAKQTSNSFAGLTPGTYFFKVTDANGCSYTESYPIAPVTPIDIKGQRITNVLCNGGSTGIAKYTVSGFSAPGNYVITVTTTPTGLSYIQNVSGDVITLSDLAPGSYLVNVTDNTTGCSKAANVNITQPAPLALSLAGNVNANCNIATSRVTVMPSGGTAPFTYSFVQDGASPVTYTNFNSVNLNPATSLNWDAWVKDANGCLAKLDVSIATDSAPLLTATVINQCIASGSAFQIQVVGSNGVAPYTYSISTGAAPTGPLADTFTVAPGTYSITVLDANGCKTIVPFTVNNVLTATAVLTKDITCSMPKDATIKVDVLGGKAPFGYRVNIGGAGFTGTPIAFAGTSFVYTAVSATGNTYQFEITDANGTSCTTLTNTITTSTPVMVTASETHVDPTCNGFTDGSIKLTAGAGVAPFTYSIDGGSTFSSSNVFGGLTGLPAPGKPYNYVVRDAKGCDATGTINLIEPPVIATTITPHPIQCNSNAPGSIDVTIDSGGIAPFTYTIYDNKYTQIATTGPIGATTHNFGGLNFGDYFITIVDSKGCEFKSVKTKILTPPNISATGVASTGSCLTGATATINVLSGAAPFTYSIYGQPSTAFGPTASASHIFTGLDHGVTYQFQVIDAGGCFTIVEVTTPFLSAIVIDPITTTNVACNGGADNGSVSFTVKNYDASVTQLLVEVRDQLTNLPIVPAKKLSFTGLTGGNVTGTITGLKAGTYTLFVKESNGTECNNSEKFEITQPAQPLSSNIVSNVNANCNSGALVTLNTTGGTGPYTYAYAVAPTTPSVFASGNVLTLNPGVSGTDLNWNIIVKDANGCTVPLNTPIIVDPSPVIALSVVNKCVAEGAFGINVTETTAGTGAYSISVDNGTFVSIAGLPYIVTGLNSGSHTIAIKDANGCTDTKTILIDAPLQLMPTIDALPTCGNSDGQITLTPLGGTGSYTYSISPVAGSISGNVISGLPAGTYTITMTDTATPTACSTTASVTLKAPTPVTFTAVPTSVSCFGSSDGTITVNLAASNDNPVYTYAISPVPAGSVKVDNVFSNLPAGTYTITVTSGRNCTASDANVVVGTPAALSATATTTIPLSCGTGNIAQPATITINGVDGTAPYLYSFDGGINYSSDNTYESSVATTFDVYVKDAKGCIFILTNGVNIPALDPPTDLAVALTVAPTCPLPTATVTLTATDGVLPLSYTILPSVPAGVTQTGNVFSGLIPGDYTFQVTDANGCTYQELYTVKPVTPIEIVGALVSDVSCNALNGANNNGSAKYTVTGFSATGNYAIAVTSIPASLPFTQTVSGDVINLSNLVAGEYIVTVTDNTTGCQDSDSVTLTEPAPITFTTSASKVYCSQDISQITVNGVTGGTGVYTYAAVKLGDPAPAASDYASNPVISVDTDLTELSWDVYVKDANGCISAKVTTAVVFDAVPTISLPAQQCYIGAPLTVDLNTVTTTHNGVKLFSVDGFALATSIATFNGPGTYVLGIKDDNGCEDFVSYTIEEQILSTATLTKDLYCASPTAATIDVVITNGVGPFSTQMYSGISPTGTPIGSPYAGAAFTANVAAAGDYYFVTTDSNPAVCLVTSNKVTVSVPATPTFNTTQTNVSCFGGNDGSITVIPADGMAPYTFALTGTGANNSGDSTGIYTGLIQGSYTVVVTDAKGCTSAVAPAIVITEPGLLSVIATPSINTTCSVSTVITAVASNGTPVYYYSFDNGVTYDTSNTFTVNDNGNVQTIWYSAKDANGCTTAPQSITVNPLNKPTDLDFALTVAPTCPTPTATVTLTATNGVATLQYETIAPSAMIIGKQTSNVFAGLIPGDYTFQVTDANGCTYQELYKVDPVTPIEIGGALVSDISCNALNGINNNGSAKYTVTGFSATGNYAIAVTSVPASLPFTQTVSGDVISLTNLIAGEYTVTVTDNTTGCQDSDSVTLTEPAPITFTTSASKVYCSQDISQITVSGVTGGTGVYTYAAMKLGDPAPAASDYNSNPVISVDTDLTELSWDVYVKDANGCISAKVTRSVVFDAVPTISLPAQQCYIGAPLTVDLNTVTTTYNNVKSYTLDGSALATSIATFNGPGTYVLGIKDDNGCEDTVSYTIEKQILSTATLTKDLYCAAPTDATIDVVITNGVGPFSTQMYSGISPTGSPVGSPYAGATFTANVAAAGDYYFVTTDSNPAVCLVTSNKVTVSVPATPTFNTTQTNVSCIGGSDGTITIIASNGIAPYQYSIDNGGTFQSSNVFTGLNDAGVYNIVVKDAKECPSVAVPVDITQPAAVTASHVVTPFGCDTSNAPQDAIVTITAGGGTPGYTYSFDGGSTFQASPSFTVNAAGTISYVVLDANGCSASGSANVLPYTPPTDMDLSASPIYCTTPGTVATVTVNTVTGGVAPYTYEIISPVSIAPNGTNSFGNLAPATYVIKVTDANGCSTTKAIVVEEADKISVTAQLLNDVFCKGGVTGAVNFTVANYITAGSYTFSLSPALGTYTQLGDVISYTGLPAGNYTFTVTDGVSGCVASVANFAISEPAVALSSTSVATNINCNNDTAAVTVTANGGTAPYQYAIARTGDPIPSVYGTNDQLVVDTNSGADMNWTVYVKDANGCTANSAQTIVLDTNPTIASAVATQCPSPTGTYDITVTASGFSSALLYSVDGVSYQSGNVITVYAPGTYNVTVKDANGCPSTALSVTILQPLTLDAKITKIPTCNAADGEVRLTAGGGTIPSVYEYSMDGTTYVANNVFANLAPNVTPYKFYVRDTGTGCVKMIDFKIEPAAAVTGFALSTTPVTCNGGNDGTITATMAAPESGVNDNPVYMYILNGGTPQASNIFTGLTAGTYTVDVISGRGCPATANITVTQPGVITVPAPIVAEFGCTAGTNTRNYATITVNNVTGGSGTYSIYEFFKAGISVQRGASNVYTVTDLTGGNYTVTVYDNKGCQGSTSTAIPIAPFISLDKINVAINNAITCTNDENITVKVATLGGTPAPGTIEYTVTGINGTAYTRPTNTTGIFKDLGVGFYSIAVKNTVTGCTTDIIHYVNAPNTFELQAVKTSDVKCFGSNEGEVELTLVDQIPTPTNEAGAFSYVVTGPNGTSPIVNSPDAGPLKLSGLKAGNYSVTATLTGSPYCSVSVPFTIVEPSAKLDITETHTDITCVPGNDGSIQATATGGWDAGYEYQLELGSSIISAWSSTTQFAGLSAGTYTVRVRDIKGCTDFVDVELKNPTPLAIAVTPINTKVSCYGDKSATITATASFGQGSNYLYTLNYESLTPVVSSGPQGTGVFTGLGAGRYTVTVTDGWGCSATSAIVTIDEPAIVEASLVLSKSQTCAPLSAELTLSAKGGTAPYSYSATLNIASSIPMGAANSVTFPVGNGTFHYYVWDANGCASYISNDIQNDPLVPLTIDLDRQNAVVNCKGDLSGVIVAVAKGGLGNYVYTLLNSAGTAVSPAPTQSTPGRFDFLPAGTYSVKVDSGDCSKIEGPVTISEPATSLVPTVSIVPVTCNGNGDGKIIVTATGGTGIIKYAIEPNMNQFFETGTFENLKPGLYDVIVQDQNGCFELLKDLEIKEPTPIDAIVDPTSIVQEYCAGDKTGAFSVAISGGTAPYSSVLDDPKGTYVPVQDPTNVVFSGLEGGAHKVYIMDANTCTFELIVTLDKPVTLNPVASVNYDCVNDLPANKVTVTVDASNNPGDVVYSLDNSNTTQTSNVFTNLTPGDHFILAHHINTCIDATAVFTIDKIDPLAISIDLGGLNEIVATVTGGSGVYHYSVNGEDIGTNNKYIYYHTGDYTVTVTDSNGCSVSATKHFEFIDIEIPNVFTPNGNGTNDTWKPERTENYPDIQFVVYDRYGREVGKFGAGQGWDGKYKGNELPMGDYWYVLKLRNSKDDREFIGHFTLYR